MRQIKLNFPSNLLVNFDVYELLWVRVEAVVIGALYHPPRPQYAVESLVDYTEAYVKEVVRSFPQALVILAGDFNELSTNVLREHTGLSPLVHKPNILDQSLASWPKYSKVHVLASLISSDHKAITVCTVAQNCCNGRSKKYRKWHFLGCSLSKTPQRIDIKFGRDDYVGDGSQYAKWHISRFRDVISANG